VAAEKLAPFTRATHVKIGVRPGNPGDYAFGPSVPLGRGSVVASCGRSSIREWATMAGCGCPANFSTAWSYCAACGLAWTMGSSCKPRWQV
jgi:hypothetical protein